MEIEDPYASSKPKHDRRDIFFFGLSLIAGAVLITVFYCYLQYGYHDATWTTGGPTPDLYFSPSSSATNSVK